MSIPRFHSSFVIGLVLLVFTGDLLASTAYRRYLRDLNSRRESASERARAELIKGADDAARALGEYMHTQPPAYRQAAFEFLPQIPGDASGAVLVDRLVTERNDKLQDFALAILKKNHNEAARKQLLHLVLDESGDHRREAAAVIKALNDGSYLDVLIDQLEKDVKDSEGAAGLSVGVSRVDGFDTHKRTVVVRTPDGPKKITQTMRMPRISGTSVAGRNGIPSSQALIAITGKNFGHDLSKWRAYRAKHYRKK